VLQHKELQTVATMIAEDKVKKIFCMADDSCMFFDAMMPKHAVIA